MFICTYLFLLPSHSVNTQRKYDRIQLWGFHLFCSDSLAPVMTCKWCARTISCCSWMDLGMHYLVYLQRVIKGGTICYLVLHCLILARTLFISFSLFLSFFFSLKSCGHTSRSLSTFVVTHTQNQISVPFDSYWTAVTHEITCSMSEPTSSVKCRTSIWLNT